MKNTKIMKEYDMQYIVLEKIDYFTVKYKLTILHKRS